MDGTKLKILKISRNKQMVCAIGTVPGGEKYTFGMLHKSSESVKI